MTETDLKVEIRKSEKKLRVLDGEDVIQVLDVVFGFTPEGSKEVEGDGRTPQGEYVVCVKNPESKFHLSLGLNYPNDSDARRGLAAGLIDQNEHDAILDALNSGKLPPQNTALGGEIYIHGGGTDGDWTRGCIALENDEMKALFDAIKIGTLVVIRE